MLEVRHFRKGTKQSYIITHHALVCLTCKSRKGGTRGGEGGGSDSEEVPAVGPQPVRAARRKDCRGEEVSGNPALLLRRFLHFCFAVLPRSF